MSDDRRNHHYGHRGYTDDNGEVSNRCSCIQGIKHMRREIEAVEEMKKEAAKVREEITKLRARVQTQLCTRSTRTV